MQVTLEAKTTTDMVGSRVPGVYLSYKTPKFKRSVQISRKSDNGFGRNTEVTTPTGKRVVYRRLPFGWELETARGPRVPHLVGIPPNLTMDDVVSFFGEEFPTLVRGALKYALNYGWTKVDDPEEYKSIVSVLEGKHHQEVELTEEEKRHQDELFEKLLNNEREFGEFCTCEMCEDIEQRESETRRLNKKIYDETMKRVFRIIPQLGD